MRHRNQARRRAAALCIALGFAGLGASSVAADENDASVAQPCVRHSNLKRTKILDDRNILFVMRNGEIYHNPLPHECPSVRRNSLLNYQIANGQLCEGSTFTVLWQVGTNWVPAFVCPLGKFVPISEDEAQDLTALTEEQPRSRRNPRGAREMIQVERVDLPPETAPTPAEQSPPAQ